MRSFNCSSLFFVMLSIFVMSAIARTVIHKNSKQHIPPKSNGPMANEAIERCVVNGSVSLTFDDGPYTLTPAILDVLKEKNVTATFFINGQNWLDIYENEEAREIIQRTVAEGHTIGSHTWTHITLTTLTELNEIREQMTNLSTALTSFNLLNYELTLFRPPEGEYNDDIVSVVQGELGYIIVNWSIDSEDWMHPGNTSAGLQNYIDALEGTVPEETQGHISLHHDVWEGGAELASQVIDYVQTAGYKIVSLEECLGLPGKPAPPTASPVLDTTPAPVDIPVRNRCKDNGTLAITFDDGPSLLTPAVLDILLEKKVTAAFFINGENTMNIHDEPAYGIVRRALEEGHTVGSHTWSHKLLTASTPDVIREEMTKLSTALTSLNLLSKAPVFMRPPEGAYNDEVLVIVNQGLGYTIVNWSIDTLDWSHPGNTSEGLQAYIDELEGTDPSATLGHISLHHDIHEGGAELAAQSIDYIRSKGYRIVSLEECLGFPAQEGVLPSSAGSIMLRLWMIPVYAFVNLIIFVL